MWMGLALIDILLLRLLALFTEDGGGDHGV